MKMSSDTRKAISVILIYVPFLSFLIGMAARLKESFHSRVKPQRGDSPSRQYSWRWEWPRSFFPRKKAELRPARGPSSDTCESGLAGKLSSICPDAAAIFQIAAAPPLFTTNVIPALRR